jgi:hypothetical protein
MIADFAVPQAWTRRRAGRRHRLRLLVSDGRFARAAGRTRWDRFWDDRRAIRLKVILLVCCLLAAALLEMPR